MRCEEGLHYFFSHKGFCQCGERTTEVYDAGYDQGRKDAIDEVMVLLRSKEAQFIYPDYAHYGGCSENELCEWLESKLKEGVR